jgi:hypothetical protein
MTWASVWRQFSDFVGACRKGLDRFRLLQNAKGKRLRANSQPFAPANVESRRYDFSDISKKKSQKRLN